MINICVTDEVTIFKFIVCVNGIIILPSFPLDMVLEYALEL